MKYKCVLLHILLFFCFTGFLFSQEGIRIKDIARIQEIRENQLSGFGLVTGLSGRGDSDSSVLLKKVISNMLSGFGVTIRQNDVKSKNSAVVMVTADIPPFVRPGDRISVTAASLGDAKSLEGGVLLQTPLTGANGIVYAVAQGQIALTDSGSSGKTVGTVPEGGIIEREVASLIPENEYISILLGNPDFTTAQATAEGIQGELENVKVKAVDASLIRVEVPEEFKENYIEFISRIEGIFIKPDTIAKVVINPRSGIVVMGGNVKIGNVAVSYRGDQISVGSGFGNDDSEKEQFVLDEETSVGELVTVMQEIGLSTNIIIEIVKAIDKAGALYGKLVIM